MFVCGDFAKDLDPISEGLAQVHVRLLATSDLHANLLPYDYYTDRRDDAVGLIRLAGLIAAARADAPNCLVLDNGDTLQGAPLGDVAVSEMLPRGSIHPMIAAMNAIGYDAATLGNHDFDYGIAVLDTAVSQARFPVVLANARRACGRPYRPGHVMLSRRMRDRDGKPHDLRIGITGAVPPQVAQWNRSVLGDALTFSGAVDAVAREAVALRALGADLVVVLAHSGLGGAPDDAGAGGEGENTARDIAGLPDVDAVIAGHTHEVFPAAGDCSTNHGHAPIVQPGFSGSHLGCIDIALERQEPRPDGQRHLWRVVKARAEAIPASGERSDRPCSLRRVLRQNPQLRTQLPGQHRAARSYTGRKLGEAAISLTTYFSFLAPCAATQLVSDAQRAAGLAAVAAHPGLRGLPILSAVAPFRCGGRGGPFDYTDIPPGPLLLRHAADLYCYPNLLAILRVRGRDLRLWLERSASLYRQIDPERPSPQLLVDHAFAGYNFDRIDGLLYDIDVSRPAWTNPHGDRVFGKGGRVLNLRHSDGTPVDDDDEVLVVTNSYRASGGGHFHTCRSSETVLTGTHAVRDHLVSFIREAAGPIAPVPARTFRLTGFGRAEVVVETGPGALRHGDRLAELGLAHLGTGGSGFERFVLVT